ncbi:hypothetical protein R0K19_28150, partial [Bacillus sp. SIMBA_161]
GIIIASSAVIWISAFAYQENVLERPAISQELLSDNFATHPGAATYLEDGRLTPTEDYEESYLPSLESAKQDRSVIYE